MLELCSIASGSSGNCICVGTDETHVLIDTGISGKKVEEGLNSLGLTASDMKGILLTHEHIDHVAGIGVMARRHGLPIYATEKTIDAVKRMSSLGKIDPGLFHVIEKNVDFTLGDLTFHPMPVSHDAADPVAYRFTNGKRRMAVITDLGIYTDKQVEELQGLDGILLESNHDIHMLECGIYPYPLKQRILGDHGHLSNERSGQFLSRLLHDDFKGAILGHLSKENNLEELAYETVRIEVNTAECPYKASDFELQVAKRDRVSAKIRLD